MTPEQMARLVAGDFDCHDYVEINVGGTGPNEADFETLDTPGVVIRGLATELITLQQEKAALLAERDSARNVCLEWDTLRLEQEVKEKDEVIWACRADGADLLADNRRLREALEELLKLPRREEWIGGQRAHYINVDPATFIIDAALAATPRCGDRDRYSPRVCRLPAGHAGDHEDPTFVDVGAAPTVLMDPDDCAKTRHGTVRCDRCGQEWDAAR